MTTTTTIRSPVAMLLGLVCALATGYVLLEDVAHGGAFTTAHLLSVVAILIAIAAGHMAWPQLTEGRILGGLGLALLLTGATTYTVISAGSRNAELAAHKAEAISQTNADRAAIEPKLSEAIEMLEAQRSRVQKECTSGEGTRCRGAKASLDVYEAAVTGYESRLGKLPPKREANAGYAHVARVIAAMPGVTAEPKAIEDRLTLLVPFLLVLVVEFGTIIFFGVAFRSGRRTKTTPETANDNTGPPAVPPGGDKVVDWVRAFRRRHGRSPRIPELQARFPGTPKTTAWRRCKAA